MRLVVRVKKELTSTLINPKKEKQKLKSLKQGSLRYVIGRKYRYLLCLNRRFYWPSMLTATPHTL